MSTSYSQILPEALEYVLRHRGEEWRRVWNHEFKWTSQHFSKDEIRPMMFTYDTVAEDALNRLDELSPPPPRPAQNAGEGNGVPPGAEEEKKRPQRDLVALIKEHAATDEVVGRLWKQANTVPEWVDWEQIERGQKVFLRYSGPSILAVRPF